MIIGKNIRTRHDAYSGLFSINVVIKGPLQLVKQSLSMKSHLWTYQFLLVHPNVTDSNAEAQHL